jgi:hypothetical protein
MREQSSDTPILYKSHIFSEFKPNARVAADNIAYSIGLSERIRSSVEERGRVTLGDAAASALVRTKTLHVVLLVVTTIAGVVWEGFPVNQLLTFFAFLVGGIAEVFADGATATAAAKLKAAVKVCGTWLLGMTTFFVVLIITATG